MVKIRQGDVALERANDLRRLRRRRERPLPRQVDIQVVADESDVRERDDGRDRHHDSPRVNGGPDAAEPRHQRQAEPEDE